jgi:ribosomal protein L33
MAKKGEPERKVILLLCRVKSSCLAGHFFWIWDKNARNDINRMALRK